MHAIRDLATGNERTIADVVAFGTGSHTPGGQNHIQADVRLNGPLTTSRAFNVGLTAGDLFVNGNLSFGAAVSVDGDVHRKRFQVLSVSYNFAF